MGLQLIFVVETNKKCKSDWIYIKDTIDRFYQYDQAQVKFSPVPPCPCVLSFDGSR